MRSADEIKLLPASSMAMAVKSIDAGGGRIAFVVGHDDVLIGTITDGDIRRALLRGESMEVPVSDIMCQKFHALDHLPSNEEVRAFMGKHGLHQVPVVDKAGRLEGFFRIEDLLSVPRRANRVVIMAGGKGSRLRPFTENCPKPMVRVGDKPMLEIILEQCIDSGFGQFYISVNYLKEQIKDYFGDGARWGVVIEYLEEDRELGTAGALNLLPEQPSEPLLVLNGDILTKFDFGHLLSFHVENSALATLCVREYLTEVPFGVVSLDDSTVLALEEKPVFSHYVNAGVYLLDPTLLKMIPSKKFFDMPELIEKVLGIQGRVAAFPIHEYWLDVGHPKALDQAHLEWKLKK